MDSERVIAPATVTVRPATLFDAVCVALESGEFRQIRGMMYQSGRGACAWGVVRTVAARAGVRCEADVHPRFLEIERRAGQMLGYACMEEANDAGEHFGIIAAALRAARIEIERG